jgi:glucosamine 6-phosphate synthetase-like amidotransferase/phosphosugar isomerase protein
MCNIAGYIGCEQAAPILLKIMAEQEGLGGGYYTGIATIHERKLYYRKVIGDVSTLMSETDAKELPGTIGIIHSRTKSGGNVEWGHPFVDEYERMAYIANGSGGYFEEERDKNSVAQSLFDAGHIFRSRTPGPTGKYPLLSDGTSLHVSEVMCHLIESFIPECGGPVEAMHKAFITFPSELVGLMVHIDIPDCIVASRINQPLLIGRDDKATYLATTAMAFPEVQWIWPMPTTATAAIYRDKIHVLPFESSRYSVANIYPWHEAYERIIELLSDGEPKSLGALVKVTEELWPEGELSQNTMMVYEILRSLYTTGKIHFQTVAVDGVIKGTSSPRKQAILKRT